MTAKRCKTNDLARPTSAMEAKPGPVPVRCGGGAYGPSALCTCQECRDAADADREAQEYDAWISHAIMVNGRLAAVRCGGCERPVEAMAETVNGMTTITTQQPCPCGWGKREG